MKVFVSFYSAVWRSRRLMPSLFLLAGCACASVSGIFGCGGGGSTPSPTASAAPTSSPDPTPVPVQVGVIPSVATVSIGGTQTFTATVTGVSDQRVAWTVLEGSVGGMISENGVYIAPPITGRYHIVAVSVARPDQTATVPVDVKTGGTEVTIQ